MREKLLREYVRRIITEQYTVQDILVGQTACSVEIADTDNTRAQGMMGRRDIPDGTGMLFVYPQSMYLSFWMKNTPSPLSIAFIDETGKIIEIVDLKPFSERSIKSSSPCRAALEVPQGWFGKNRIVPGDFIS